MRILYFSSFYRSFPFKEAAFDRTHCFVGGERDIGNCNPTVNSELSSGLICNSTSAHLLSESQIVQTFLSDRHATQRLKFIGHVPCVCVQIRLLFLSGSYNILSQSSLKKVCFRQYFILLYL